MLILDINFVCAKLKQTTVCPRDKPKKTDSWRNCRHCSSRHKPGTVCPRYCARCDQHRKSGTRCPETKRVRK